MWSRFKAIAQSEWDQSVIRRATALLCFTLPATILNLGFNYSASKILAPVEFGILYTAITSINILFAPSVVLNFFFSRIVAQISARFGSSQADMALWDISYIIGKWLGLLSLLGLATLVLLKLLGQKFSGSLALLIILIVFGSYLAEAGRTVLQGTQRFMRLGIYTLGWMTIRFVLGIVGLWVFSAVWGGLVGIALSAPLVLLLFFGLPPIRRAFESGLREAPRISAFTPFAIGYGLFATTAHVDILIAYATLDRTELGIYSASSVLPKGLLMLSLPVVQLAFPMMVGRQVAVLPSTSVIVKGLLLTFLLTAFGAAAIMTVSEPVCSGAYGITACDPKTMAFALAAIVMFCLLRFLISVDFAANRDWLPSLLAAPLVLFAAYAVGDSHDPLELARLFFVFSLMTLLFYPLVRAVHPLMARLRPGPRQERRND